MRVRLMVGHIPLEDGIGVRVPDPQPNFKRRLISRFCEKSSDIIKVMELQPNFNEENPLKEKIEVIKSLEVDAGSKALMLLVLLDEKPVSVIDVKNKVEVSRIIEKSESIGLFAAVTKELKEDEESWGFQLAVSKSKDLVVELQEIIKKKTGTLDHKRYGELMGFPDTAIQAHIGVDTEGSMNVEEYREVAGKYFHLFGFRPSKKHSEEELKLLERWYSLIVENAPELLAAPR